MNWSYELFDIGQAEKYTKQSKSPFPYPHQTSSHTPADQSDYWPSISSPNSSLTSGGSGSSINVGAIIGGTLGGAFCLLLIFVSGYFLCERRQYRRLYNVDGAIPIPRMDMPMTNMHARWPSDSFTAFSLTPPGSPPPMSFMTTHPWQGMGTGTIVRSTTSYSSFRTTSPTPTSIETASFLTTGNTAVQRTHAIPMV
ncbi:hypothetical protein J3R83DRAFT_13420 [Lanmaoa asiatica]|nr:hypothetical protein J3R83DRAFT_13420 [Lanmaoa asiatica]